MEKDGEFSRIPSMGWPKKKSSFCYCSYTSILHTPVLTFQLSFSLKYSIALSFHFRVFLSSYSSFHSLPVTNPHWDAAFESFSNLQVIFLLIRQAQHFLQTFIILIIHFIYTICTTQIIHSNCVDPKQWGVPACRTTSSLWQSRLVSRYRVRLSTQTALRNKNLNIPQPLKYWYNQWAGNQSLD